MGKKDKELLLKELCARLPYGVICYWRIGSELTLNLTEYNGQLTCINKVEIEDSSDYYYDCYFNICNDSNGNSFQNEDVPIEIVKPYLRPMSSISSLISAKEWTSLGGIDLIDWYNANHIDYRGLIEKGLALEAPEGMYDLKEK